MASSSRPFQSQTATRLVSAYRAWSYKAQAVLRRAQVGAAWGIQVALYPVYVLFQTSRILYRQITAADPVGGLARLLKPFLQTSQAAQADSAIPLPNAAQNPLERLLLWLQMPAHSALDAALLGLPDDCAALAGSFGQQPPLLRVRASEKLQIQGVATDLKSRALVLVTPDNTVWDILTQSEQAALGRVMLWLMTERNHAQWRQNQRLAAPRLPLLSPNRRAWWPVQLFQHLMRWMSVGAVAATTNLFGEAQWGHRPHWRQRVGNQYLLKPSQERQAAVGQALPSGSPSPVQFGAHRVPANARAHTGLMIYSEAAGPGLQKRKQAPAQLHGEVQTPSPKEIQKKLRQEGAFAGEASTALPEAGWIETRATVISYIDHPLVVVLRGIDQGLLWLERLTQQMWRWLRSHLTL